MAITDNERASILAQQASGHIITRGLFSIKDRPTLSNKYTCEGRSARGELGEHVEVIEERKTDQEGLGKGSVEGDQDEMGVTRV
jgi:hypothetical protein